MFDLNADRKSYAWNTTVNNTTSVRSNTDNTTLDSGNSYLVGAGGIAGQGLENIGNTYNQKYDNKRSIAGDVGGYGAFNVFSDSSNRSVKSSYNTGALKVGDSSSYFGGYNNQIKNLRIGDKITDKKKVKNVTKNITKNKTVIQGNTGTGEKLSDTIASLGTPTAAPLVPVNSTAGFLGRYRLYLAVGAGALLLWLWTKRRR